MKLESIAKGALVSGIEAGKVVRVVSADPLGDNAVTVVYKADDGRLGERVLFRSNESELQIASVGRPWSFDADGADFKLAAEAYRINLAHLFDPMMAGGVAQAGTTRAWSPTRCTRVAQARDTPSALALTP